MTDTARFADVLLPATTVFEQRELHKSYGHYLLQYSEPVIDAGRRVAQQSGAVRAPGACHGTSTSRRCRPRRSSCWPRRSTAPARARRRRRRPARTTAPWRCASVATTELIQFGTDFPTTASGQVELSPPGCDRVAYRPPPRRLSARAAQPRDRQDDQLDLRRVQPAASAPRHASGRRRRARRARRQAVRVFNDLGEVQVPVRLTRDLRPGMVTLPKGLWRSSTLNGSRQPRWCPTP